MTMRFCSFFSAVPLSLLSIGIHALSIGSVSSWTQGNYGVASRTLCESRSYSRRPIIVSRKFLTAAATAGSDHDSFNDDQAWKLEGERIIREAAARAGARDDQISVHWKVGKVVVTVEDAYLPGDQQQDDDDELWRDEKGVLMELTDDDEWLVSEPPTPQGGADVVSIARAINAALEEQGEGSVGYSIALHHEIEVTTPGASDELTGIMFESYRGFPVLVDTIDGKTNKQKVVEGKLVERTDEFTKINVKGRMRKFPNHLVESVRLPKAKKEKGAR